MWEFAFSRCNYEPTQVFKLQQQDQISHQIFAWGESKNYQLALETEGAVPQPIMIEFNQTVRHLYSRSDFNFIVTKQGDCYSWGSNLFGRLGFANTIKNQKFPAQVKSLNKVKSISMGKYHCIAITQQYEAFSWGHGMHGQLGLQEIMSQTTPKKIKCDQKIIQAACGEYHSIVLTEKLSLMSCGSNAYHALGHIEVDQKKRCKKFTKINVNFEENIIKIVSGNRHNLLLTTDGHVYSWGCNKYGQLGRLQVDQISVRRELYKGVSSNEFSKKNSPEILTKKCEYESPFSQYKQRQCQTKIDKSSLQICLFNWKKKYQQFKKEQQKRQKQLMQEFDQIIKSKQ